MSATTTARKTAPSPPGGEPITLRQGRIEVPSTPVIPFIEGDGTGPVDINGDKLPDLLTSLGHDYGIFWLEQQRAANGERNWNKHVIDNSWSQAHAMTLIDLNGDGQPEIVTGKRYMAHNGRDPGEREPLGVYWYEWLTVNGRLEWKKHIIDYSSRAGGGMQIPVIDIDRDGDLDVVTAGKSGLFLFEQSDSADE